MNSFASGTAFLASRLVGSFGDDDQHWRTTGMPRKRKFNMHTALSSDSRARVRFGPQVHIRTWQELARLLWTSSFLLDLLLRSLRSSQRTVLSSFWQCSDAAALAKEWHHQSLLGYSRRKDYLCTQACTPSQHAENRRTVLRVEELVIQTGCGDEVDKTVELVRIVCYADQVYSRRCLMGPSSKHSDLPSRAVVLQLLRAWYQMRHVDSMMV